MTGSLLATGDTECGISCPAMSRGGDREAGRGRRKGGVKALQVEAGGGSQLV